MITTTLNEILKHGPCGQQLESDKGWQKGLKFLKKTTGDNEPISLLTILESNGFSDALWCLRAVEGYDREIRLFSAWCACNSLKYYEKKYNDTRVRFAIESAILYAEGEIETGELDAAYAAACEATCDAAYAATWAAAWAAAYAAAYDAAWAAAGAAAYAAAWDAAGAAEQEKEFIKMCKEGHNYKRNQEG